MPQNLQIGDAVEFAHLDNIYRGIIIIKHDNSQANQPNTSAEHSETFLVQSVSVRSDGSWSSAHNLCVDFPALALTRVPRTGLEKSVGA